MKTKAAKQSKKSKPTVHLKDIKPTKDAKGGISLLLPAVQKVREAAARSGGTKSLLGDGSV